MSRNKKTQKEPEKIEDKKVEESKETEDIVQKKKLPKVKTLIVIAQRDTQLPDGTFISKGQEVEVTVEYVERLKAEGVKDFIIK